MRFRFALHDRIDEQLHSSLPLDAEVLTVDVLNDVLQPGQRTRLLPALLQGPRPELSPAWHEVVILTQSNCKIERQSVSVDHGEDVDDKLAVRRLTENSQASRWDIAILLLNIAERIRTSNLRFRKPVLFQLSCDDVVRPEGLEPPTSWFVARRSDPTELRA